MRKGILIFVCLTQACHLQAQREQDPIQAILQLFEQHPIVTFGEVSVVNFWVKTLEYLADWCQRGVRIIALRSRSTLAARLGT